MKRIPSEKDCCQEAENLCKETKKLTCKISIISGGNARIAQTLATDFAKDGTHISIIYLKKDANTSEITQLIEEKRESCFLFSKNEGKKCCSFDIHRPKAFFGKIEILEDCDCQKQTENRTKKAESNVLSYFFVIKVPLRHVLKTQENVEDLTSLSSRENIMEFTRSLALSMSQKEKSLKEFQPKWIPFIPCSSQSTKTCSEVCMKYAGQSEEIALCYISLESRYTPYISGEILHFQEQINFHSQQSQQLNPQR